MDNSKIQISIFLDLSKAFDLLDHNILLYKLKYYGINSNSLQLLENVMGVRVRLGGLASFGLRVSSDCDARSLARAVRRYCSRFL